MPLKLFLAALVFLCSTPVFAAETSPAAPAKSCLQEVGKQKSAEYVAQCTQVSPATHPPCNAANPCSLILDEIKRSCALLKGDPKTYPKFCDDYPA